MIFPAVMASIFKSHAEHLDGLLLIPKRFIWWKAVIFYLSSDNIPQH